MNQNVPTDKIKQPDLVSLFQKENVSWESIGLQKDRSLNSTKGLNVYTGEFGASQKKHLLQRTLIGYRHASFTQIQNLSLSACVDMLLSPEKAFDLPINDY